MIGVLPALIIVFLLVSLVHRAVTGKKNLLWTALGVVCLFVAVLFFSTGLKKDVLALNQTVVMVSEGASDDHVDISFRLKEGGDKNVYAHIDWVNKNRTVVTINFRKVNSDYFLVDPKRGGNAVYSIKVPWPENQTTLNIEFAGKLIGEWSKKE